MSINIKHIKLQSPADNSSSKLDKSVINTFFEREIKLFSNKLSLEKKEEFYAELSMLLSSGLDIRSIFHLLLKEKEKSKHKKFYHKSYDNLIKGDNLSDALQSTGYISPHEYYSIKIGEETGKLKEVLTDLNDYFARRIKQKRQLISTFSYPVMIIVTAVVVVTFMLNFIVPMFEDVFKRFNGELPGLTRWILSTSGFFQKYIGVLVVFWLTLVFSAWSVRNMEWYRKYMSSIVLRIPGLRILLSKIYLARFCQTMSLMIGAKIPLVSALGLMGKIINFYPFERAMDKMKKDVINGIPLNKSMESFSYFDLKLKSLTKVGEEVNQLALIYNKLSLQYTDEVQHKIGILNSLMEPLLIVIIGVLVALILVAMYLPMFQMSNSFF